MKKLIVILTLATLIMGMQCTAYANETEDGSVGYVSAIKGLNVRETPDKESDSNIITAIPLNTEVTYWESEDDEWYYIALDDETEGYVYYKYISDEKTEVPVEKVQTSSATYSPSYFKKMGVIKWGGYRWTWYSQKVLPGGGLKIPGRHVDGSGYVCDGDGYICLASDTLSKGTVVSTPFGKQGKVYDCGTGSSDILDVYCNF